MPAIPSPWMTALVQESSSSNAAWRSVLRSLRGRSAPGRLRAPSPTRSDARPRQPGWSRALQGPSVTLSSWRGPGYCAKDVSGRQEGRDQRENVTAKRTAAAEKDMTNERTVPRGT